MSLRIELDAIRRRFADPREVATALGLMAGATRQRSGGLMVRCPAHADRGRPNLSLTLGADSTIRAKCFSCDFTADLLGLVAAVDGLDIAHDFRRVAERAQELAGGGVVTRSTSGPIDPPAVRLDVERFDAMARALAHMGRLDGRGVSARACLYLARRGLLEAAIADSWFAVAPPASQLLADAFSAEELRASGLVDSTGALKNPTHELVIPWRDRLGRIDTIQRRRLDGLEAAKYLFPFSRGALHPYGCDRLTNTTRELVIVEGATDALARRQFDDRTVLGVPGVSWSPPMGWAQLVAGRTVRIAFDADAPGDIAADKLAPIVRKAGAVRVIRERPRGAKDWSELLEMLARKDAA